MNIKFESDDNNLLHELHLFIYQHDQEIVIDEHYEMTPGANKEPIVTTLVATIGSKAVLNFIQKMVKEFIKFKIAKEKEDTKRTRDIQKHQENLLKIYLKNGGKWDKIDIDKLDQLRIQE